MNYLHTIVFVLYLQYLKQYKMDNNLEIKKALENFNRAFEKLNNTWSKLNIDLSEKYPFEKSFDDYAIKEWVESSIK